MADSRTLNIFVKSRYSLSEEDRVVNGLLVLLQHCAPSLLRSFLTLGGVPTDLDDSFSIRDHVILSPESVVDGELCMPDTLLMIIEAKIERAQLEDPEQAQRYFSHLLERQESTRVLLLLSPDSTEPAVVSQIAGQTESCYVTWRSWDAIHRLLRRVEQEPAQQTNRDQFLLSHYLEYLSILGLAAEPEDPLFNEKQLRPQLHFLLGNVAAEKILLHLYHHGGGNLRGIARDHNLGRGATERVLRRFVQAGLLVRESRGRVVWYTFNNRNPMLKPLLEIVRLVYECIPESKRKETFEPSRVLDQ